MGHPTAHSLFNPLQIACVTGAFPGKVLKNGNTAKYFQIDKILHDFR
jgi:hypothetical protein